MTCTHYPEGQGSGASADAETGSRPTDQAPMGLDAARFDPARDEDAFALESWAFNVMLECSGLKKDQSSEVAIGGALLFLRDLERILEWARGVATAGDPDALTGCADDYDDDRLDVCGNIGCEDGWVSDCFDGLCVNAEDGCELCMRRCNWCNPRSASVDTHAQRGDSTQVEAPSPMGSAVRDSGDAPTVKP